MRLRALYKFCASARGGRRGARVVRDGSVHNAAVNALGGEIGGVPQASTPRRFSRARRATRRSVRRRRRFTMAGTV